MIQIVEFPKYYISRQGKVYNFKGLELKTRLDKDGYLYVPLRKGGNSQRRSIHRLLATAYIPNPENLPVINHKNGIRRDNRIENLEWCSIQHNVKHGFDINGRQSLKGAEKPNSKLTDEAVKDIRALVSLGISLTSLSKYYGVSIESVSRISKKQRWVHVQ
jgi:hypothetical protein